MAPRIFDATVHAASPWTFELPGLALAFLPFCGALPTTSLSEPRQNCKRTKHRVRATCPPEGGFMKSRLTLNAVQNPPGNHVFEFWNLFLATRQPLSGL